jgi:archaellum component FlaC
MLRQIGIKINEIGKKVTGFSSSSDISKLEIKDSALKKLIVSNAEKIELLQEEIEALNQAFESFYKKTRVLIFLNIILFFTVLVLLYIIF